MEKIFYLSSDSEELDAFQKAFTNDYFVLTADNESNAYDLLNFSPDAQIVISDLCLKENDGISFLEKVNIIYPEKTLILAANQENRNKLIDNIDHINFFLYKPFITKQLKLFLNSLVKLLNSDKEKRSLMRIIETSTLFYSFFPIVKKRINRSFDITRIIIDTIVLRLKNYNNIENDYKKLCEKSLDDTQKVGANLDYLNNFFMRLRKYHEEFKSDKYENLDVDEQICEITKLYDHIFTDNSLVIDHVKKDQKLIIKCFKSQFFHIVTNLINYVIDNINKVAHNKASRPKKIVVATYNNDAYITIEVSYNYGIKDKNVERPYNNKEFNSVDTGLLITQEIVKYLGGAIEFENTEQSGRIIKVLLKRVNLNEDTNNR